MKEKTTTASAARRCSLATGGVAAWVMICALALTPTPAAGQSKREVGASNPPPTGLFGPDPRSSESVEVDVSAYGGHDDNLLQALFNSPVDATGAAALAGNYTGLDAAVKYSRRHSSSFDLTGGGSYRYYPVARTLNSMDQWLGVGLRTPMTRRTRVTLSSSLEYSPFYAMGSPSGLLQGTGQVLLLNADYGVRRSPTLTYAGDVTLEHDLGPRTSLILSYGIRRWGLGEDAPLIVSQAVRAALRRRVSRYLALHAGYTYRPPQRSGPYAGSFLFRAHDVNLGVEYSRALGPSRRTSFGFTSGSSVVTGAFGASYNLSGNAYFNRDIARTWHTRVSYTRGLDVVQGVAQSFFSDTVSGSLAGYLHRRVDLLVSGSYTNSSFTPTTPAQALAFARTPAFDTYAASARVRFALTRRSALFGQYVYYHYKFAAAVVPAFTPALVNRQSIRFGLSVWLPVMTRGSASARRR